MRTRICKKIYSCDICNRTFKFLSVMDMNRIVRSYACNKANCTFKQVSELNLHKRCNLCGYSSFQYAHLYKQRKGHFRH